MDPPHVQALADDCHPQPHQHSPSHTCAHWSRRWRAAGKQRCSGERRCCREVSHAGSWACAFATHCLSSPAWREGGRTQGRRAEPQLAAGGCAQHAVGAAHCTPHCLAHAAPHCCCRNMKPGRQAGRQAGRQLTRSPSSAHTRCTRPALACLAGSSTWSARCAAAPAGTPFHGTDRSRHLHHMCRT